MADKGGHKNIKSQPVSRASRRFYNQRKRRQQQLEIINDNETPIIQNVIIKKRPPRRPKLKNKILDLTNDNDCSTSSKNFIVEDCITEVKKKLKTLNLGQSSKTTIIENSESSTSTSGQSPCGLLPSPDDDSCIPSTSSKTCYFPENRRGEKKKIDKHKLYINNHVRSKPRKPNQATEDAKPDEENKKSPIKERKNRRAKDRRRKENRLFNSHLSIDTAKNLLLLQDLENPKFIEGHIRINPRCYQNAYVSLSNGETDVLIIGLKDRNRALEGDLVVVNINDEEKWLKDNNNVAHKTGVVVCILEKTHRRKAVGFLKKQDVFVYLQPRDSRVPIIKLRPKTVPEAFYDNPDLFKETLFLGNIVDWKKIAHAEGEIQMCLGKKGDLSIETNAILLENDLNVDPYDDQLLKDLPPADYILTEADIASRDDLRKKCIFTIDPATAVDLDDAVSCIPLENGNFEVGIHIADVTHFLKEFSDLDCEVSERGNTVYLVDNVYHMLPKQLCLACSLLPGHDKLAFSVILEMTANAEIVNHRFCKTVINSCCQMSYEQAQSMIDDKDCTCDWLQKSSLKIYNGYKAEDLLKVVQDLYNIAVKLRTKRFSEGALRIDQPKLSVFLDSSTKLPVSYTIEERKESNSLIEEFMLLANMTVAKHLYENFPEFSLLRSHAEPTMRMLRKTQNLLQKLGVLLDVDSSCSLHNSLMMHQPEQNFELVGPAQYRMMVINTLCAKSMTRAIYRCSAAVNSKEELKHYALNADYYTHFTSPIRRYPDCVVHRLLYSSISNQVVHSEWSPEHCAKIASICNTKKYSAKQAQEQSNALYFTYWLDLRGSMEALAIVMDVKERSADAMLCDTGLKLRLYFNDTVEETTSEFKVEHDVPTVRITWTERQVVQVINIFSILNVKITKHPQLFRLQGVLLPPPNLG